MNNEFKCDYCERYVLQIMWIAREEAFLCCTCVNDLISQLDIECLEKASDIEFLEKWEGTM